MCAGTLWDLFRQSPEMFRLQAFWMFHIIRLMPLHIGHKLPSQPALHPKGQPGDVGKSRVDA